MRNEIMLIKNNDHQWGNAQASLTLIEYGDYQCPYCARAHSLVERLMKEFGREILFSFRNFPLQEIHPLALHAAQSAEAAGVQGKFWTMHHMIFNNQRKITHNFLRYLAVELSLNMEQFERDQKDETIRARIEEEFEEGLRNGVNRTPTFFLNGERFNHYDETYESLRDLVTSNL